MDRKVIIGDVAGDRRPRSIAFIAIAIDAHSRCKSTCGKAKSRFNGATNIIIGLISGLGFMSWSETGGYGFW